MQGGTVLPYIHSVGYNGQNTLWWHQHALSVVFHHPNRYAREVMGADKYTCWREITIEDLKAFVGFSIQMGVNGLPSLDDYWQLDKTLRYALIADRISRDRFRDISRHLHFVDNNTLAPRGTPNHDQLGKIRPLLNHITQKVHGAL